MSRQSFEDRPAHWVLAEMGKNVLRPGGTAMTDDLVDALGITAADDVVEFAPGTGFTAQRLLERGPNAYTGIELDAEAAEALRRKLGGPTREIRTENAGATSLESDCADVVLGEAMLTMQPNDGKREIVAEAARLLRPGGVYGIHEMGLRPDDIGADLRSQIHDDLAEVLKVNAQPIPRAEWIAILESAGFEVSVRRTAPMELLGPRRVIEDEGLLGTLRIVGNVLTTPAARKRIRRMRSVFQQYEEHLSAITIVAEKPA